MGVREGQGMAFEFLAPRTALCKPFSTRRRISYGLPERSIGKTDVTFLASATGIENPLSGSRFLLRRFPLCRSALEDRTLDTKGCCGLAKLEGHHLVSPVQPRASIQSSLQLHAGAAHGRLNLFPLHPVNRAMPAHRVILPHRTALPNAQHGSQIRCRRQSTMSVPRQLRLATKAPVPEWHIHLLTPTTSPLLFRVGTIAPENSPPRCPNQKKRAGGTPA